MCNLKYSIVYAVIRPEINEQLSVGIILMDDVRTVFRYSENKIQALKTLYTEKEYDFFVKLIKGMANDKTITTEQGINYLHRYSNNLLTVSKLQAVELPLTEESSNWMFTQYIDRKARYTA